MKNVMKGFRTLVLVAVLLSPIIGNSQEKEVFKPVVKWNIKAQIWMRYADLNDGSLVNGEPTSSYSDISIRRLRIPISAQVTPKVMMYAMFGGNNYNIKGGQVSLDVLDMYGEYTFGKYLAIGLGKSGWQGLNRWNIRSSGTLMGLDSPLLSLNTVGKSDHLGRQFGIWFKGQVSKFDYRLSVTTPQVVSSAPKVGKVDFANNRPRKKVSTYVKYQFFEHESNKSAYQIGTYMQSKKVFNIGAGYQFQGKAMSDGDAASGAAPVDAAANFYDMKHWAVDSFLNLPLDNKDAITAYLGYYDYGFGDDYIRNVGANNVTSGGGNDFNGAGVAFPMMGTGSTWYMQFGYAFEKAKVFGQEMIIQPNIAIQHSDWDALNQKMTVYDFGINFMLNGTHANKISLGYQYRPIFDKISLEQKDSKGMAVLQYSIAFN